LQSGDGKKIPPPTPEGHEGRLFPPEQRSLRYLSGELQMENSYIAIRRSSRGRMWQSTPARGDSEQAICDAGSFEFAAIVSISSCVSAAVIFCLGTVDFKLRDGRFFDPSQWILAVNVSQFRPPQNTEICVNSPCNKDNGVL
jgi:hypothetical protein